VTHTTEAEHEEFHREVKELRAEATANAVIGTGTEPVYANDTPNVIELLRVWLMRVGYSIAIKNNKKVVVPEGVSSTTTATVCVIGSTELHGACIAVHCTSYCYCNNHCALQSLHTLPVCSSSTASSGISMRMPS
jgi:hypothetical protein